MKDDEEPNLNKMGFTLKSVGPPDEHGKCIVQILNRNGVPVVETNQPVTGEEGFSLATAWARTLLEGKAEE